MPSLNSLDFILRRIFISVVQVIGVGTVLGVASAVSPLQSEAHAQGADQTAVYRIQAGPLGVALNQFAAVSGIYLSGQASLTQGKSSPGLQGSHTVASGLAALLHGTGLEAVPQGNGQYSLREMPQAQSDAGVHTLSSIRVRAASPAQESATNYTVRRSSSASKLELELKETPQSVSVFTEKMVQDLAIGSISEVFEWTPGVTVLENGVPGAGRVVYYARGFAINNFQMDGVMLDGFAFGGQNNASNRTAVGMQDPFVYERMDIVRGSTGLTTGSGDPAASLNFTRKRPLAERRIQANVKIGQWDFRRAEFDFSTPLSDSGAWRARFVGASQRGNSHLDRVSQRGQTGYGITELDITPDTMLSLGFSHLTRNIDGAGPHGTRRSTSYRSWDPDLKRYVMKVSSADYLDRSHNSATQWSYRDFSWRNYFVTLEHGFRNGWRVNAAYNRIMATSDRFYGVIGSQFYLPEYDVASYDVYREKYDNHISAYDFNLSGDFELLGRQHDFVIGMNAIKTRSVGYAFPSGPASLTFPTVDGPNKNSDAFSYYYQNQWFRPSAWNEGDVALPYITQSQKDFGFLNWDTPRVGASTATWQRGVYVSARLRPTERLQTILGARYGRGTKNYHAPRSFIPYAGLVYELTPSTNVYASYTRIEKPQTPSDGRPVGADGQFLDPIQGNSLEFGVKAGLMDNRLNLAASYFTMTQNNVGVMDPNGPLVTDPDYPQNGARNPSYKGIDGYRVYGLDLSFAGQITSDWMIAGGYIYQRQNIPDELLELAASTEEFEESFFFPKHSIKLFTTYRLSEHWTVGGGVTWQSGGKTSTQEYDENGLARGFVHQGSYALVNLMARYRHNEHLTLGLNINNAFDKWYFTNANIANYGTPRNIVATVQLSF